MLGECQLHVKSQSELDIGGRETCSSYFKISYILIYARQNYIETFLYLFILMMVFANESCSIQCLRN